jgi:hypothetical protein
MLRCTDKAAASGRGCKPLSLFLLTALCLHLGQCPPCLGGDLSAASELDLSLGHDRGRHLGDRFVDGIETILR